MSTEANIAIPGEIHPPQPDSKTQAGHGSKTEASQEQPGTVQRNIQASKGHALQAAEELKTAVEAKGRELLHVADELLQAADGKASQIKAKAESAYDEAKSQVKVLQRQTEDYVRRNPLGSVCMALGAGFVVGILARR